MATAMLGGRRMPETAFLALLFFCLIWRSAYARPAHYVFNERISAAAVGAIGSHGGPLEGQTQAEYLQALAENCYGAVMRLPTGSDEKLSDIPFRFSVVVWPWQIRSEFSSTVQYGSPKGAYRNRLKIEHGAVPYSVCTWHSGPGEFPELGEPCLVGNSVHGIAKNSVGQWMHYMIFYNSLKPVAHEGNMKEIFEKVVKECRSPVSPSAEAATSSSELLIDLTAIAECVFTESSGLLRKKYRATFRGMAAIISYNPGRSLEPGGLHDDFAVVSELGGIFIDHFTVSVPPKPVMLMGKPIFKGEIQYLSVYLITKFGTLASEPASKKKSNG